jgi:hypothetical protein
MENYLIGLSANILLEAQNNNNTLSLRRELHYLKLRKLVSILDSNELKTTFWTNIYNAFSLIIAAEVTVTDSLGKHKRIKIAGNILSLDDIEFKILKCHNNSMGQKIMATLFNSTFIKGLAVSSGDKMSHLKLNR